MHNSLTEMTEPSTSFDSPWKDILVSEKSSAILGFISLHFLKTEISCIMT